MNTPYWTIDSSEVIPMKQSSVRLIAAAAGMVVLILDAKSAISAASEGIMLCIRTLIPALFPFFIFSSLLTSSLTGNNTSFLRPLEKVCRLPKGCGSLLIVGFLGGYPAGARCVAQAANEGKISYEDGARLLPLCNNCGPSFLFGIIAAMFPEHRDVWILWLIMICSTILTARLFPGDACKQAGDMSETGTTVIEAVESAVRSTGVLCGWVIIFRIILSFMYRWLFPFFPDALSVLLTGLMELANGCVALGTISDYKLRFLICAVMLSFGGLCVTLQTKSVSGNLSFRYYFPGKLLQCGFSIVLALNYLVFFCGYVPILLRSAVSSVDFIIVILFIYLHRKKNLVAIPKKMMYNWNT